MSDALIRAAFDRALSEARIDPTSLRWVGNARNVLSVRISGVMYRAKVAVPTPDSTREAIAECLRQHCTLVAVREAAGILTVEQIAADITKEGLPV